MAKKDDNDTLVRCKDCKYHYRDRDKYGKFALFCNHVMMPNNISFDNRAKGFGCTLGEKKEGEKK